jgi:hypothetical protein
MGCTRVGCREQAADFSFLACHFGPRSGPTNIEDTMRRIIVIDSDSHEEVLRTFSAHQVATFMLGRDIRHYRVLVDVGDFPPEHHKLVEHIEEIISLLKSKEYQQ